MKPVVSIILPTYNRASLLPRAVDSVLAQSWTSWELIVVDDGSIDDTVAVVSRYCRADARIHLLQQDNGGPGAARNRGFEKSNGDLVTFLDSDDEYLPEHVAIRVAYLEQYPDVGLLHGGVLLPSPGSDEMVPDARDPSRILSIHDCAVGGTFFARREVLQRGPGWPGGYAEDAALLEALSRLANVARITNATYVYHRDTADSRCTSVRSHSRKA